MQAFGHIQNVAGPVENTPELWVGETGWPTAGSTYQNAVPGVSSAQTFWSNAICVASWIGV